VIKESKYLPVRL